MKTVTKFIVVTITERHDQNQTTVTKYHRRFGIQQEQRMNGTSRTYQGCLLNCGRGGSHWKHRAYWEKPWALDAMRI